MVIRNTYPNHGHSSDFLCFLNKVSLEDIYFMFTSPGPYLGFFCLRGQTLHTLTGVSRIQTRFLVGRFCFLPYTESCLKDRLFIKEKKKTH